MSQIGIIKSISWELLNRNPEPVQAYIIMKELLGLPEDDSLFAGAREKMMCSKYVKELSETQELNGTWGRFHSQDSSVKSKFPTTEKAVNRALSLGLDRENSILRKSAAYMSSVTQGGASWTDRAEKFNEWPEMVKLITAATLSRIDRKHPAISGIRRLWAEIAKRAFETGRHELTQELAAFEAITGISPTKKDTKLNKIYPLILLSTADNSLPPEIEKAYLEWIWNNEEGIYYLTWFSLDVLYEITSKEFPSWLRAVDIISDYVYGKLLTKRAMEYIWSLRDEEGLWDFGADSKASDYAKRHFGWQLGSSWRTETTRKIDSTIRVLLLLKKEE